MQTTQTSWKRPSPFRSRDDEPSQKRRKINSSGDSRSVPIRKDIEYLPLTTPTIPDDVWRLIFHYLDVGHISARMALLSRNWARCCWYFCSAFVVAPSVLDKPAQFKYRPTGLMNSLVRIPLPQYLRTLVLHSIKLTEAEVTPIYNFPHIQTLVLSVVRGRTFQELSRLSSLRQLTTWNCEWVNKDILGHIGRLVRLEQLTLNCCDQITDEGLHHLSNLTNLVSLGLTDLTGISEVGLRHLSTLRNLGTLTLTYNPVSDAMVDVIAEHHVAKLQVLDLDAETLGEGNLTDKGLASLGKLTNLRRLKLGYHSFTPAGLRQLAGLTNLESLSLESVEGAVTGDSLRSLSKLVNLRKINFESCSGFDDHVMAALSSFTKLEHLNIAKTMFKRGLHYLSSTTHPKLTYLDVSYAERWDDVGLRHLSRLTNLESLQMYRCPKGTISPKGTRVLLKLEKLNFLDCRECPLAPDVAQTLKARIEDMKDTFNMIPTVASTDSLDSPIESEEILDSDEETSHPQESPPTTMGEDTNCNMDIYYASEYELDTAEESEAEDERCDRTLLAAIHTRRSQSPPGVREDDEMSIDSINSYCPSITSSPRQDMESDVEFESID